MILRYFTLLLSVIFLFGCNETDGQEQQQTTQTQDEATTTSATDAATLTIIGKNINLRDEGSTLGKPIGQAQDGEKYEILSRSSEYETIGVETDYWYEIEKMGESAWIFGAYTSKNLNDNEQGFEGVFQGASFGDYIHVDFSIGEAVMDFGEGASVGKNNYGEYDKVYFEEEGQEKYVGKTFRVTWKVQLEEVYAGEGSMDLVKREVPVITSLELLD